MNTSLLITAGLPLMKAINAPFNDILISQLGDSKSFQRVKISNQGFFFFFFLFFWGGGHPAETAMISRKI